MNTIHILMIIVGYLIIMFVVYAVLSYISETTAQYIPQLPSVVISILFPIGIPAVFIFYVICGIFYVMHRIDCMVDYYVDVKRSKDKRRHKPCDA
jgi:TRAP-type mannitol/chloroaromatic compound transport system permease small subunit